MNVDRYAMAAGLLFASAHSAGAAIVTNKDTHVQILVVTQGATKGQIVVGAGQTVDFCNQGCFVTFPNGDRAALRGSEAVELSGGKVTIK